MADIKTETVTYKAGGKTLQSHLAYDASRTGKRPGIVVYGEWWGLNDYPKRRARELAELGYVALAADVYGEAKTVDDVQSASASMNALFADMASTTEVVKAAVTTLAARPEVDAGRLGAMGYCLGGTLSLHAARLGLDLKGVVSFHGTLSKTHEAKQGDFKAKVLVCHGAADAFVPPDQIDAFKQEMADLGVDLKFVAYPGAVHAFTNPAATERGQRFGIPLAYDEKADKQSWEEMKAFWARVFA